MERVPMTKKGAEELKQLLAYLKGEKRHQIVSTIESARAHGDLSENAEYHAAKEEQGMNEGRITDIEDKLARAHVIDPATIKAEKVVFGATVELIDVNKGTEVTYQIVGVDEADIEKGMVSITSPIARAMIGKEEGDLAVVQAPGGEREFEIQAIEYV
ncbi:transcription elongation factor GreA [Mariprofundus ferrooxydans]|uniref:transcription elongation factor GreA n=1 Tax=Mariprofundus ferrooxydans TaxID=314344 RepID=UPI00035E243E|nr:transcription elongation factor GreA [Mariprofundus ferrooxydans]